MTHSLEVGVQRTLSSSRGRRSSSPWFISSCATWRICDTLSHPQFALSAVVLLSIRDSQRKCSTVATVRRSGSLAYRQEKKVIYILNYWLRAFSKEQNNTTLFLSLLLYIMLLHHHETNKLIQVPPDPPSMKNTINYPPNLIILIILQLGCSLTHFIQEIIYRVPNARTSSVTGQLPSLFEDEMRANLFLKTQIMPLF